MFDRVTLTPTITDPIIPDAPFAAGPVGDWLLTFSPGETALPVRCPGSAWRETERGAGWQAWVSDPVEGWRGGPSLVVESSAWSARLIGELYGTDRPAASILDVLEDRAPVAGLNGHFLLVARHRPSDEWHVWTNRHATLHAYLATGGGRAAVGTFAPAVAAATGRTELDWEGLSSLFAFGFFGADRTHLAGLRILRPATHYRLDARGTLLAEERYWYWSHAPDAARSYDETLEEFAGLFTGVMGELTARGRIALPISGGLDSRSTVAAITANSPAAGRLWAYSYGYHDDSVETHIAGQVAAVRGVPFDAYTIQPYLFERLPAIMAAIEGFEDVTQCRQAAVTGEIAAHADYVIAAHWGDVYLDDMGVDAAHIPADGLAGLALKKFSKGGASWLLDHLCRPQMGTTEPRQVLGQMVGSELDRLGRVEDPDFQIKMLKTDQWSARWTTVALRVFQGAAFPRLPFYDTRLVDFFCTVPTAFVGGRRLQLDYLRRYAPDLARVPWQVTGHDLFHSGRDGLWDTARRAARKGRRLLAGRKTMERNWEVQFMGEAGRAGLEYWLVRPGLALHEFVSPQAVRDLLAAFRSDPLVEKRSYTVAMLLSFSAWLELQWGRGAA